MSRPSPAISVGLRPKSRKILRQKRIAIAGLGGTGSAHLLTLARLGVRAFHIADFDKYDIPNLNRQAAAFMSTMGISKVEAASRMAKDINPTVNIQTFAQGCAFAS